MWPPTPWLGRQDRQRYRGRDQPVGRRALLLAGARGALYPGVPDCRSEWDTGFRTKPQLAVELVHAAREAGIQFRAWWRTASMVITPLHRRPGGRQGPLEASLKPRKGIWASAVRPTPRSRWPASSLAQPQPAWAVAAGRPLLPRRACRDLVGGGCGAWRLGSRSAAAASVATTDPGRLPGHSSWYLLTNSARPASRGQQANLAEVVRLYGLRNRVEQGYKQVIAGHRESGLTSRSAATGRSGGTGHWVLCVLILLPAILAEQLAAPESQVIDPAAMRGTTDQAPGGTGCARLVAGGVAPGAGLANPLRRCWRSWSPAPAGTDTTAA